MNQAFVDQEVPMSEANFTDPNTWLQIEREFVEVGGEALAELAEQGLKEKWMRFWVGFEDGTVFVHTEAEPDSDGVAMFELEALTEAFSNGWEMPVRELEASIFKHFGNALMALKQKGAFDALADGKLVIKVATADRDGPDVTTVG